jgi:hypothetical protein
MGILVKAFTRESASERVGLTSTDALNLRYPTRAMGAESKHQWERDDRARTAEREDEIEQMLAERRSAARLQELIGSDKPKDERRKPGKLRTSDRG